MASEDTDSRSICLAPGVERAAAHNEATIVADVRGLQMRSGRTGRIFVGEVPEASFEQLYRAHFGELSAAYAKHARQPGVLVAAIVPGHGLRGRLWLAADATLRAGIAGRHERADLHLPDDPALALRHLAILARADGDGIRVRVFDLRTGTLFRDEADRPLAAVAANGPLFLGASLHRFFLIPTGAFTSLPDWDALPPRSFADVREDAPLPAERPMLVAAAPHAGLSESTVVTAGAPLAAPEWLDLVAEGESPLGHLRVSVRGRTTVLTIGAARAQRGILLGRYERCDGVCPATWLPMEVSRVHAMLLYEGGQLHVIDAGSTNGTVLRGRNIHCEPMPPGERVELARAHVIWDPAN